MIIELFGEYGKGLEIDKSGGAYDVIQLKDMNALCGIGAAVNESLIAIYGVNGQFFLRIGNEEWGFADEFDSVEFRKDEGGISRLVVRNCARVVHDFQYPSWWRRKGDTNPVGFGDIDDEEHDIGAYLSFMWSSDRRRKHLMQKYHCSATK